MHLVLAQVSKHKNKEIKFYGFCDLTFNIRGVIGLKEVEGSMTKNGTRGLHEKIAFQKVGLRK